MSADDYYPFGMTMPGRSYNQGFDRNIYKYSSKELDEEQFTGAMLQTKPLDWYYFGARYYPMIRQLTDDPEIGRFLAVDPLAGKAPAWTPYRYGFNNPLKFIDPTGMEEKNKEGEDGSEEGNEKESEDDSDENYVWINGNKYHVNIAEALAQDGFFGSAYDVTYQNNTYSVSKDKNGNSQVMLKANTKLAGSAYGISSGLAWAVNQGKMGFQVGKFWPRSTSNNPGLALSNLSKTSEAFKYAQGQLNAFKIAGKVGVGLTIVATGMEIAMANDARSRWQAAFGGAFGLAGGILGGMGGTALLPGWGTVAGALGGSFSGNEFGRAVGGRLYDELMPNMNKYRIQY
ncbi:MAG: RHS repeat-associated core domain-containing protein [Calditrichaceae bacterium]